MAKIIDAVRHAVETSDQTRYRIAKESGVSAGQLCRLVHRESGLSVETAERLAEYLGLEIIVRQKGRTRRMK